MLVLLRCSCGVPPPSLSSLVLLPRRRKGGEEGDRQRGGILGLGALLATAVFAYGYWSGCRKAEILAINDNGQIHHMWTLISCRVPPCLPALRAALIMQMIRTANWWRTTSGCLASRPCEKLEATGLETCQTC